MEQSEAGEELDALARNAAPAHDSVGEDYVRNKLAQQLFGRESVPRRFGRFELGAPIGKGGMGTVFTAWDPMLERDVALKVVDASRLGTRMAERALREARGLAKLAHPNVVSVFEAGEVEHRVWIAMELLAGKTMGEWIEQEPVPSPEEIVRQWIAVGRGLIAVHEAGLVHRDVKPSNVVIGDDGRPRLIDFGLVRDPGQRTELDEADSGEAETDASGSPTVGFVGTRAYAAPEQRVGEPADARADQYSLCVSLWESLGGRDPKASDGWASLPPRVVRAVERGMAERREDRYTSLGPLLAELEAALAARVRNRRLRWGAMGVVAIGASVWGADAYEGWQRQRSEQACRDTSAQATEAMWSDATRTATIERLRSTKASFAETTATSTREYLDDYASSWQEANTEACLAHRVEQTWSADRRDRAKWCLDQREMALTTLVELLHEADVEVASRAVDAAAGLPSVAPCRDPALVQRLPAPPDESKRAEVGRVRSQIYRAEVLDAVGRYDDGLEVAEAATKDAEALGLPSLRAMAGVALGDLLESKAQYARAREVFEDAYFQAAQVRDFETAVEASTELVQLVGFRLMQWDEGDRWARLADLALTELDVGDDDVRRARLLRARGLIDKAAARYEPAKEQHERALSIQREVQGADHPDLAVTLNALGGAYRALRDVEAATASYDEAQAIAARVFGPGHPQVAVGLHNLCVMRKAARDFDEARSLCERSLAIKRSALGEAHPSVAEGLLSLARLDWSQGHNERAKERTEQALAIWEAALGPDHPSLATALDLLGTMANALGDRDRAEASLVRAVSIRERALGAEHPRLAFSLGGLARVYDAQGKNEQTERMLLRTLPMYRAVLGDKHPNIGPTLNHLANLAMKVGNHDKALDYGRQALAAYEAAREPGHVHIALGHTMLGEIHAAAGQLEQAAAEHEQGVTLHEQALGPDDDQLLTPLHGLARVYGKLGRYDEAAPLYERAARIVALRSKEPNPEEPNFLRRAAQARLDGGDAAAALVLFERAMEHYDRSDGDTPGEPEARFGLAQALVATGGARHRAKALARESMAHLDLEKALDREFAEKVEAWLRTGQAP